MRSELDFAFRFLNAQIKSNNHMSNNQPDSGGEMRDFIDRWRDTALSEVAHQDQMIKDHPVAWWFNKTNATTEQFMAALAGDKDLVVPGKPSDSVFLTRFLRPSRPMGKRLAADRHIVEKWITDGCPMPQQPTKPSPDNGRSGGGNGGPPPVLFLPTMKPEEIQSHEPEYFHRLINIESFPGFLPTARQLARYYLDIGRQNEQAAPADSKFKAFPYTEDAFDARMKSIYDAYVATVMYEPHEFESGIIEFDDEAGVTKKFSVGRFSDKVVRERIYQLAPFNLVDGAWLQSVITVGPSSQVQSNLFAIWDDEAGNGVVAQNHANVYDALLRSQNIYLPPITTREFIEQDFLPGAFTASVFELAVGRFPQEFLPELLGMTLYLEWEATPTLTPIAKMMAARRINPHFYRLHIAIDNISEGHGALAKESVKLYLEAIREEAGDGAVQQHWQRIWIGYVTWATLGGLGKELYERFLAIDRKQINLSADPSKKKCWPDFAEYSRTQMLRLIARKAPYARQVHGGKALGGQALNALFDDPPKLLDGLVESGMVNPDRPRESRFIALMDFTGPMYKVFTERDKSIVLDWIESLRPSVPKCTDPLGSAPSPTDLPGKVAALISAKASVAATFHDGIILTLSSGEQVPLKNLFARPADLMKALVNCGWVVPREEDRSMFVTRLIRNNGPMSRAFTTDEIMLITEWIKQGANMPTTVPLTFAIRLAAEDTSDARWVRYRRLTGMGVVH